MNNKKVEELENLKQNYLILKELFVYYKNVLEYNNQILEESKEKEVVKVKKLNFY